jgi:hypothetical protein
LARESANSRPLLYDFTVANESLFGYFPIGSDPIKSPEALMRTTVGGIFTSIALLGLITTNSAQAQSAQSLIGEAAKATGGMAALRALKNQLVESEGKQFDSSSTPRPLGPMRQINTFRYTLTRDLTQPRIRLEWDSRNSARGEALRFVEVIDGSTGLLQEGEAKTAKQSRLHPGRRVTRLSACTATARRCKPRAPRRKVRNSQGRKEKTHETIMVLDRAYNQTFPRCRCSARSNWRDDHNRSSARQARACGPRGTPADPRTDDTHT